MIGKCVALFLGLLTSTVAAQLPDTKPLTLEGDIASAMVEGADRFLLQKLDQSVASRARHWKRDASSPDAYWESLKPNREELSQILGICGQLVPFESPRINATIDEANPIRMPAGLTIQNVRWPVVDRLWGDGLLLEPAGPVRADVVLIPDADQTPESILRRTGASLATSGCRVLIVRTISRERSRRNNRANLTNREFLHRPAFELGRTLIGYETHMVLAAVNWFANDKAERPIGVLGHGEGGMAAMFAGALDSRIAVTCISGFFGPRKQSWKEPLDRNIFRFLDQFGCAELLSMIAPRPVVIATNAGPEISLDGDGGAPAELKGVPPQAVRFEASRAAKLVPAEFRSWTITDRADLGVGEFLGALIQTKPSLAIAQFDGSRPTDVAQAELIEHIDRYNQWLLDESRFERQKFMAKLDTSSVESYEKTVEPYRKHFAEKTIGQFNDQLLPFNARSRKKYDTKSYVGYEVVLDVFPDVIAYGILLLPKDLKPGERRPAVVCQHGLEGRPTDTIENNHRAYHDFAAKLCERGYITFAPQNPYIFQDRFRTLQRKANPLGKTLFSLIVPQHQQTVNWLQTLPNVDPKRIAFYGLSYGGKSAMRIPPLVPDYCLSICSADFNEWVRKNATTRENFSYVWTGEYEIFEFDLGSTFNYAEMAALIAPRPFMVERGHFDGVGIDEWVAFEFAKVRRLYAAQLKLPDRCEIEWFVGPHTINGQGTFRFLDRHLTWKPRQ